MERNNPEIKLHGNEKGNGHLGVLAVAATVAAWDLSDNQTITNYVESQVYHEDWRRRAVALGSLIYLGMHLTDKWNTRIDPIDCAARGVERLRDKITSWTTRGVHLP